MGVVLAPLDSSAKEANDGGVSGSLNPHPRLGQAVGVGAGACLLGDRIKLDVSIIRLLAVVSWVPREGFRSLCKLQFCGDGLQK
jgi:hypothetical protein